MMVAKEENEVSEVRDSPEESVFTVLDLPSCFFLRGPEAEVFACRSQAPESQCAAHE